MSRPSITCYIQTEDPVMKSETKYTNYVEIYEPTDLRCKLQFSLS